MNWLPRILHRRPLTPATAAEVCEHIHAHEAGALADLHSMIHHPRSLERPLPGWRPPATRVPALFSRGRPVLELTRRRVDAHLHSRAAGAEGEHSPAYLLSMRMSDPRGHEVPPAIAAGWARALVDAPEPGFLHELTAEDQPAYAWLVDADFRPVRSPAELFTGSSQAA